MSSKWAYKTLKAPSEGQFKDRGSKFLAYAYPILDEVQIKEYLDIVKSDHPKARHYCYAWRQGLDKTNYRANDDGEPSGTAGKPILGQIDSFELTYVFVVVVRYFGGTQLGTSGLVNAYKQATIEALSNAVIINKEVQLLYSLHFGYEEMNQIIYELKKMKATIISKRFDEKCFLKIAINKSKVELLNHLDMNYRNLNLVISETNEID